MNKVSFKQSSDLHEIAGRVYQEQRERIQKLIPWAEVHHIGSTAIPGSITKGDLDINVRVPVENFDNAVKGLEKLYQINQPENWTNNFASFKDDDNFDIAGGVQLTIMGSESDDFIKLNDLLINDSQLLKEYNQMKEKFEGKDMEEYRKEKANFFGKLRKQFK